MRFKLFIALAAIVSLFIFMSSSYAASAETVTINNISDSPDPFSPDGDGIDDTSLISATVSNSGFSSGKPLRFKSRISIKNSQGTELTYFNQTGKAYADKDINISATWDGKDSSGQRAAEGICYYEITATINKTDAVPASGTVTVSLSTPPGPDTQPPTITVTQPDTPTNQDVILSYTVSDNVTAPENIVVTGDNSPYTQEGEYSITLTAYDEAENPGTSNTVSFIIDKTAPEIIITSPQDGAIVDTSTITLEGTVDGAAFSEERSLQEGENIVTKTAADQAGNTGSDSITVTSTSTPPPPQGETVTINNISDSPDPFSPNADGVDDTTKITATVNTSGFNTGRPLRFKARLSIKNSQGVELIYFPWSERISENTDVNLSQVWNGKDSLGQTVPEGIYSYEFSAEANKVTAVPKTGTITVALIIPPQDTEAPTITVTQPNTPTNQDVILSYTVSDNVTAPENIVVTGDDSPYTQEGDYSVTLTAKDEAGNQATSAPISFTIDKTPPKIVITSPQDGALVNTPTITLEGTVDGVPFSESRNLTEGLNTLIRVATDAAGNISSASITVTLDTIPPEVIITSPQANSIFTTPDIILEGTIDGVPFSEFRTLQDAGENTVIKEATDAAGNRGSASIVVIYEPGELIGPEGGEVASFDGRIRLIIPAGALSEPTYISISRLDLTAFEGKTPNDYSSMVAVKCEPMGLVLQKEAQLIVKLNNQEVPGTELDLGLYNYGLDKVELLGQSSPVASDGFTVNFTLWHFSEYLGLKNMISQGGPIGGGVQIPLPDLLTGSYSYEVPIVVPPGRAKMQPDISFKYNSSNSNSWVGYGWNFNPGYIMRSTKHGVPSYNDTEDTFILVSGNASTELVYLIDNLYQTRVESEFSRFYKEADDSWKVVQKDGTILRFGTTQDSKETSPDGTFSWKLTKVVDNNGNYVALSYIKDEGKSYLSSISYTGNENTLSSSAHTVSFYLEDRDDVISSYISGSKILMRKRLKTIEVSIGYNLIWRYELNYEYAPETNRSLLKFIQRFTSDGKPFPEQRFYYQNHDGQLE